MGFRPERVPDPADYHVLLSLVAGGQGVALVPRSLNAITRKGIVYKDVSEGHQLRISVGVAYRVAEEMEAATSLGRPSQGPTCRGICSQGMRPFWR